MSWPTHFGVGTGLRRLDVMARKNPTTLLAGVGTMLTAASSNQVGAAVGAHAFGTIGPAGVVVVRQFVALAVLLPVARPGFRRYTWAQWWPSILLGVAVAVMNLSLYVSIDRVGLGTAITLEFLGPLAVAFLGSRTWVDLLCAIGACAGVYVLVLPERGTDYLGVGMGLIAAACWAAYILLNRVLGARLPGLEATATATTISACIYLPVAVVLIADGTLRGTGIGYAIFAGIFCSVIPFSADLIALRWVPARFFGVFMSVHPVLGALAGLAILGQVLRVHQWVGIGIVVATNVVAILAASRAPASQPETGQRETQPALASG
jgi:inner membrane transporter RhtA